MPRPSASPQPFDCLLFPLSSFDIHKYIILYVYIKARSTNETECAICVSETSLTVLRYDLHFYLFLLKMT